MTTEENKTLNIRVIQVSNGYVVVGPKSYISKNEEEARESVVQAFTDILEEFKKPMEREKPNNAERSVAVPRKVAQAV